MNNTIELQTKEKLQQKMNSLLFICFVAVIISIATLCMHSDFLFCFSVICVIITGYEGGRIMKPLKNQTYKVIVAQCTEKEKTGFRHQYRKFYFDAPDIDNFVIQTSDKGKYTEHRYYVMVFNDKNAPLIGANLLLSFKAKTPEKIKNK